MEDFIFKPFEEMAPEDYAKIGFKSGLEVHQQLLTEKKLFCRCPAGHYSDEYHAEILRHMRPTLSELGEYDGTALMEFKTKKDIIYRINRSTVCTYEMDDTPPFLMNREALDIAMGIGMLMESNIVDELHIARKQYLDGSIPTGFQRTAIFSIGGRIPYKDRYINLIQMSIEEDSCREVSDFGHRRIYMTDRLGMPLIETVTAPEMKTPQEVAEVNQIIRRICRSTGRVRSGIGAGREDVNVSVTGGTRIEIKGVSKIKSIPLLTYNEAMRQWNLLKIREELHRRGITSETFEAKVDDITKLVRKTAYEPVFNAVAQGKKVMCITLRGFKGILSTKTQTDTYFAKEISDRLRVIACLSHIPNLIHSDSGENTLSTADGQKIRKTIGAKDDDSLVIIWADDADIELAAQEVIARAKEATIGVPSETRQALRDGTNGFERILPGADRMYPDTDLPPLKITGERLTEIKGWLPEQFWKNEKWYKKLNIPDDLALPLSISQYARVFEKAVKNWKINPMLAAVILVQYPKRLRRKRLDTKVLTTDIMLKILEAIKDGKLVKDGVLAVMEKIARYGFYSDDILPKPASEEEFMVAMGQNLEAIKELSLINPLVKKELLIGMIMNSLRGRYDGSKVTEYINNIYKKEE